MDVSLEARVKQVGNSLAFFIPVAASRKLGLKPNEDVAVTISKKKNRQLVHLFFGAARGRKIGFSEEDRLDARQ
jgi:antitoxin component of MazEF toxin-antitoxin module